MKIKTMITTLMTTMLLATTLTVGSVSAESNALLAMNGTVSTPVDPLTVYSYKEDTSWTLWNKGLFASYVGGQLADTISTADALDRGCVESNPILGDDPSTGMVVAVKVVSGVVIYYLVEKVLVPKWGTNSRNWAYGLGTILYSGIAVHNYGLECN